MNKKAEIVGIGRGYCALPVLAALARGGVADRLLQGPVAVSDLSGNTTALLAAFRYLRNLAWVEQDGELWRLTELGRSVFKRQGAYSIIHSYRRIFEQLDDVFFGQYNGAGTLRLENLEGSGRAHIWKFFAHAAQTLKNTSARVLVDIGCGDGTFLEFARTLNVNLRLVGVDPAEESRALVKSRLGPDVLCLDGSIDSPEDLRSKLCAAGIEAVDILCSAWFTFHEVLGRAETDLVHLLDEFHRLAPQHGLIIGELFDLPSGVLAAGRHLTALPEFILFHDLSGQRLLTHTAWRSALAQTAWRERDFIGLDPLHTGEGTFFGSGIWFLS